MKNIYTGKIDVSCEIQFSSSTWRFYSFRNFCRLALAILITVIIPRSGNSQKLQLSYSYFNLTRNAGGGTTETGDTIEIHALALITGKVRSFYYIDTIPTGTQYVSNSMKLMTNEGIVFGQGGPFTDISNDDRGVYNTSPSAIRINLGTGYSNAQSGAGFGSTSGGGTVNPGDIPKFYGNTLFIVAYKLLVTASYGDTIHPTGTFYFDTTTSGSHMKSYHFSYAGIKITQNLGLCSNYLGASFSAESSFGSGNTQNRSSGAVVPGYTKVNIGANAPQDNYYSIVNNTSADGTTNNAGPYQPTSNSHRVFGGYWDIIGDHTGATNTATGNLPVSPGTTSGYMLVVNSAFTTGEAYRDTIKNVCPNTYYEFSAWIRNICGVCGIDSNSLATYTPGVLPNLAYTINNIDYYTTGNITHDTIWEKHGFIYKTGPTESQFVITIKNNAAGGGGNDWVLDDINLTTCYPNLINSPKDTATSCTGVPIILSDTVKSYFDNYTNYCWEKSTDGVNWVSTGNCSTKSPSLINGEWVYNVDTSFIPSAADSGTFYRLKVATTNSNLNDANCSVANSQKIFLKVFNVNCTTLNTQLTSFTGNIINNKADLLWTSANEANLEEYDVEKSQDGTHFSRLGVVDALNNGNETNYSFVDADLTGSVEYYRLKLVNTAGNIIYSKIIALYNKNVSFAVTTANPFRNGIKMNIFLPAEGKVVVKLYDIFGRPVSKKEIQLNQGNSSVTLDDVSGLASGMYLLRTEFNHLVIQNKLFKVNE
ncbi:MAG TPA: T9SS type A sorting domain-containing protein [Chitinophagaceae bacterium]|nr:T9SS type A sorting domain-containing protein [Chitinophagaceae bacterium]